jgi:hypothetical protein
MPCVLPQLSGCLVVWLFGYLSHDRLVVVLCVVQAHLTSLFHDVIDDGLKFQRDNLTEPIPTVPVQLLASLANLFTALFKQCKWNWTRTHTGELI